MPRRPAQPQHAARVARPLVGPTCSLAAPSAAAAKAAAGGPANELVGSRGPHPPAHPRPLPTVAGGVDAARGPTPTPMPPTPPPFSPPPAPPLPLPSSSPSSPSPPPFAPPCRLRTDPTAAPCRRRCRDRRGRLQTASRCRRPRHHCRRHHRHRRRRRRRRRQAPWRSVGTCGGAGLAPLGPKIKKMVLYWKFII